MSQENVEIVRQLLAPFEHGDLAPLFRVLNAWVGQYQPGAVTRALLAEHPDLDRARGMSIVVHGPAGALCSGSDS